MSIQTTTPSSNKMISLNKAKVGQISPTGYTRKVKGQHTIVGIVAAVAVVCMSAVAAAAAGIGTRVGSVVSKVI